ncbi:hypothetical protein, partial [Pseudomonas aeruginosa]
MALHRLAFIFLCLPLMASAAPFTLSLIHIS